MENQVEADDTPLVNGMNEEEKETESEQDNSNANANAKDEKTSESKSNETAIVNLEDKMEDKIEDEIEEAEEEEEEEEEGCWTEFIRLVKLNPCKYATCLAMCLVIIAVFSAITVLKMDRRVKPTPSPATTTTVKPTLPTTTTITTTPATTTESTTTSAPIQCNGFCTTNFQCSSRSLSNFCKCQWSWSQGPRCVQEGASPSSTKSKSQTPNFDSNNKNFYQFFMFL